jgi:dTDP-glucose pyrophosphorylase
MKNWKKTLVGPKTSIKDVLQIINRSSAQIALVTGEGGVLLGTVTDGDIRRGILAGFGLEAEVEKVMFKNPRTAASSDSLESVLESMKTLQIRQMPVIDGKGRVIGLEVLEELLNPSPQDNWVVLMAGGLGKRMSPLTDTCPKPMLRVGGRPVLEIILNQFRQAGFRKFFVSVNFMAEVIEEYFGDGSRWGVEIRYLREREKLGTAGALGLLEELPQRPLLVMNGDLLTKVNMRQLLDFHENQGAKLTMGVREYDFQVPYGVVKFEGDSVVAVDEKPVQRFFVNAGIYVLEPEVLRWVKAGKPMDMTELLAQLFSEKSKISAYPIQEYWLDIGRHSDFERAMVDVDGGIDW